MGVRLRRLREERKLTQTAVARALGISNSYLSQIEQNQRPLTVPLLLKLNAAFGVDVQFFSEDEEGRLISDVREALVEGGAEQISTVELRELALNMPAVGRALVGLHRKARQSADRAEAMALRLGENFDEGAPARMPFEQVRDFFYARRNHVAELDEAAERLYGAAGLSPRQVRSGLEAWLAQRHGVRVVVDEAEAALRRFDPLNRTLHVSPFTKQGQQAFQMAMQLAFLEFGDLIDDLLNAASLREVEARDLLRIGLAQYFAGAVCCPMPISCVRPRLSAMTSCGWAVISGSGSRRSAIGFRRCSERAARACPSSSCGWTGPAISPNASRRRIFTSPGWAVPVRYGMSMRPSPNPVAS